MIKIVSKIKILIVCVAVVFFCVTVNLVLQTVGLFSGLTENENLAIAIVSISMILSFCILPYFGMRKLFDIERIPISPKLAIRTLGEIFFVFVVGFAGAKLDFCTVFYYVTIGFCEEFLFRKLILDYLEEYSCKFFAYVSDALLFAFLIHINCNLLDNLLFRFPLGICLVFVKKKVGFPEACSLHAFYDIMLCTDIL